MGNPSFRVRTLAFVLAALMAIGAASCSGGPNEDGEAEVTLQEALEAHSAGRLDEAVDLYKQVLALDPQNKFAYYNLGVIHQTRGRAGAAEDHYQQALDIDPDFVPALFNMAVLRTEADELEEAAELYQRVIEVSPDRADAHLNLGFVLIDLGEDEDGRAEIDIAIELDPDLASRVDEEPLVTGVTASP